MMQAEESKRLTGISKREREIFESSILYRWYQWGADGWFEITATLFDKRVKKGMWEKKVESQRGKKQDEGGWNKKGCALDGSSDEWWD